MKSVYFRRLVAVVAMAVFVCLLQFAAVGQTQGIVYENFDGVSSSFVSNTVGFAAWKADNGYYVSYPNAYRGEMPLMQGNEVALETPVYDLRGFSAAFLRFSHICKIDPRDIVRVEYSIGMGGGVFTAWQAIPWTDYRGGGDANQYRQQGFNAAFYPIWNAANATAIPAQNWWREEIFDISSFAAYREVKLRFLLKKGATPGTAITYGWLIDNVEIVAGNNLIAFPSVEFIAPLVKDTVYSTGPFEVTARIASNSSAQIQAPWLKYTVVPNSGATKVDSVLMASAGFGLWKGEIAQMPLHSKVYYAVKGMDMQQNSTTVYSEYRIVKNDAFGDNAAELLSIDSPVQQAGLTASPIKIRLQNKGEYNLDTLTVYWKLNGNNPNTTTYTRGLLWDFTDTLTIGTYTPTANAYDTLTVWISHPNNTANTCSDTLKTVILYGCSGALSGNIPVAAGGLSASIETLRKCGVAGNVRLQLANGTYTENIDLTNFDAVLGNHTLTISSASGNNTDVSIQPQSGVGITLGKSNNITIENLTINASSGTHAIEMVGDCKNINIFNNRLTATTAGNVIYKFFNTGSLENITIANNVINGGYYGIRLYGGTTAGEGKNIIIRNNTLSNQSYYSLFMGYCEFSLLSNTVNSVYGMHILCCYGSIDANKIKCGLMGIYIDNMNYSNTLEKGFITNNEIILSGTTNNGYGIYLDGANVYILHNSIYADGMGLRGISIDNAANTVIKNNLLTTNGSSYPIALLGAWNQMDINYNNYYASNGSIGLAGGTISDLATWKNTVLSDQNSTNNAPSFINNTIDLQLNNYANFECPLFHKATTDIDGLQRTSTTTKGCYSGLLYTQNAALTQFVNFGKKTIQWARDTVHVIWVNGGSTALNGASIDWNFNGVNGYRATTAKTLNRGDSAVVFLGGITYFAGLNTLIAWIVNSGDVYTNDDTLQVNLYICDSLLSGNYIVGTNAGSHFQTITEALNRIRFCGIKGAVALRLQDGTYNETVNLTEQISGLNAVNTLTITTLSGNKNNVTIQSATDAGIVLGNNSHLIIDGITINANNYGVKFVTSCDNIEIKNCIIKSNTAPIYKRDGTGIVNNIRITNNTLDGGTNGFDFYAASNTTAYGTGIVFDNNKLTNQYSKAVVAHFADFASLSNNIIMSGTSTNNFWTGIDLANCNGTVNANVIRLQHNATAATGMRFADFNYRNTANYGLVANNEIRIGTIGIAVEANTNANIVHNSIYMTGSGATRGIQLANADNRLSVQNNNVITTGANGYPIYIAGINYLSQWNIDYNNLFAPTYVGYVNGDRTTLTDWRSVVLSDLHSVSVQPLFSDMQNNMALQSSKDLLCPLLPAMAARDIRDTLRTSPTTMGAYHRKQATENAAPAAVVSPTAYYNTGDPLTIQFQNLGTNTITALTIYYSINGNTPSTYNWNGSLASGATSFPVIVNPNLGLTNTFNHIVIWTANPNGLPDDEPFDDTVKISTIACGGGISGAFTIGQTGDIPNLSAAIAMLENCGVGGAVDFAIQNGTYTMPTLKKIRGTGPANTITFRSQSGTPNDVTLQGIVFDTISDIILKNVRIQTTGGAAVAFTAPATNIEIRGCNILPNSTAAGSYGIRKAANTGQAENIRMVENTITGGYNGIEFYGDNDTSRYGTNIRIDSNTITNHHYYGLYLSFAEATISHNNINSNSSQMYWTGAYIAHTNLVFNGNTIRQTAATTRSCGLALSNLNKRHTAALGMVSNNEIYIMASENGTFSPGAGIRVSEGVNARIVHNTVSNQQARGIDLAGAANTLTVRNNIFEVRNAGSYSYPIYLGSTAYLSQWDIDYNNYYNATNIGFAVSGRTTLANWKTAVSGDAHSISQQPAYVNANNNLELSDYSGLLCPVTSGVNTDIKGNSRIVNTSMGCYAMVPLSANAQLSALLNWNPRFGGDDTLKVVLGNGGTTTLNQVNYYYSFNNDPPTSASWTGNLAFGNADTLTLEYVNYLLGNNTFKVWIGSSLNNGMVADLYRPDDTISVSRTVSNCIPPLDGSVVLIVDGNNSTGTHFTTIQAAINHLSCGISGPVTIAIKDGTYQENITINSISGSNATNTVTITSFSGDSSKVIIQRTGSWDASPHIPTIFLNGAKDVILSKLTINGMAPSRTGNNTHSRAVHLATCSNVEIRNCHLMVHHSGTTAADPFAGSVASTWQNYVCISYNATGSPSNNVRILNNLIDGGVFGINLRGASATNIYDNILIENNRIINVDYSGIYTDYANSVIRNNTIIQRNVSGQNVMRGIYIGNGSADIIGNKLKIENLEQGISQMGYPTNYVYITKKCLVINNEIIADYSGTVTTSTPNRCGIFLDNGVTRASYVDVFHNSVYITGTGAKYGLSLFSAPGTTVNSFYDIQNNNIVTVPNGTTVTRAVYVQGATATNILRYNFNNNNYYSGVGVPIGRTATSTDRTLVSWKTIFTYDVGSVDVDPNFISPSLNLACMPNASLSCPLLTTVPDALKDIVGTPRNSPTEMGAYQTIPTLDALPQQIVSPAALSFVGTPTPIIVTIRNVSSVPLTSVDILWTANGTSGVYSWTGNLASGAISDTIRLGMFMPLLGNNNIQVITANPNGLQDNNPANDTLRVVSFGCLSVLGGSYTIGQAAGAHFPDITTAVQTMYTCGISAPVTFALQSGTYTENISLTGAIPGASTQNTVTFTSVAGDTAIVQLAGADYVQNVAPFMLDGVSHVTITGLHVNAVLPIPLGAASRANTIILQGNCENIEISHCLLTVPIAATAPLVGYLVNINQPNAAALRDLRITNNIIRGGAHGINFTTTGNKTNLLIQNNIIDSVDLIGITITSGSNININNNKITQRDLGSSSGTFAGGVVFNSVTNVNVFANRIKSYKLNRGISLTSTSGLIANNEIIGYATSAATAAAIYGTSSTGVNVFHNSILLTGTQAGRGIHFASALASYSYTAKNNHIITLNTTSATTYPIYLDGASATATVTLDYNNYYALANIGYTPSSAKTTLNAWRTAVGGSNDAHSVSIKPVYIDTTISLELAKADSLGCPALPLVDKDINGNARGTFTYMGAYIPLIQLDAALLGIEIPGVVTNQSYIPRVHFQNLGIDTVKKLEVGWSLNNTPQTPPAPWTGNLAQLESDAMDLGTVPSAQYGNNDIVVWLTAVNDTADVNPLNDTVRLSFYICNVLIDSVNLIGAGETYTTIAEAMDIIKECGINKDVELRLKTGTYNGNFGLTDVFPYGSPYKVKITADSGANATINSAIAIQNSTNLIIEGIAVNANIQLNGCSDIVINDCKIAGSIQKQETAGDIANIRITNNTFSGNYTSINLLATGGNNRNIVIDSNTFTNTGAYAVNADAGFVFGSISHNKITRAGTAMYLRGCEGPIVGNKIHLASSTAGNLYAINIGNHNPRNTATGRLIANNEIIINAPTPTGVHSGVYIYSPSNIDIVHNSILLQETGSNIGVSAGIYFYASTTVINILNNNIVLTSSMVAYPIYMMSGGGTGVNEALLNFNYNNYYAPTYIGFIKGYAPRTLTDWKLAMASDVGSISINPPFIDVSQSLEVDWSAFAALQCPRNPDVLHDINGTSRSSYTLIGAYGGVQLAQGYDLELKEIVEPSNATTICSPNTVSVKYAIRNLGTADYNFSTYPLSLYFQMDAELAFDTVVIKNSGILGRFQTDTIVLKNNLNVSFAGDYDITAWLSSSADTVYSNDTLRTVYNSGKIKLPYENDFTANPFQNLTVRNLTANGHVWDTIANSAIIQPVAGTKMLAFNAPAGTVSQIISNQIELNRTVQPALRFWYAHDNSNPNHHDQTVVKVLFNGDEHTAVVADYVRRYDPTYTAPTWVEHTIDLSPYTDSTCVIVVLESYSFGGVQLMDTMSIISAQNLALDAILIPDVFTNCNLYNHEIKVVLSNTTNQGVDFNKNPLNIVVQIRGAMTKDTLVVLNAGTMEPLASDTILLYPHFDFSTGAYNIKAYIDAAAKDFDQSDDTTNRPVFINPDAKITVKQMTATGSCFPIGAKVYPEVEIENAGNADLVNLPIEVTAIFLDTAYTFYDTLKGVLTPGAIVPYHFTDHYIVRAENYYIVASSVELPCDVNPLNNNTDIIECVDMRDLSVDSLVNFITPYDNVGENIRLRVKLTNYDFAADFENVKITALINDGNTTTTLTGTIPKVAALDEVVYTFPQTYSVPNVLQYTVKVFIEKVDENQLNDTLLYERATNHGISIANENGIMLGQNIPNPAKENTRIDYRIPSDGQVLFTIYNVAGQTLYTEVVEAEAGKHHITVSTADLATGIYYYSMTFNGQRIVKKMNVLR